MARVTRATTAPTGTRAPPHSTASRRGGEAPRPHQGPVERGSGDPGLRPVDPGTGTPSTARAGAAKHR